MRKNDGYISHVIKAKINAKINYKISHKRTTVTKLGADTVGLGG